MMRPYGERSSVKTLLYIAMKAPTINSQVTMNSKSLFYLCIVYVIIDNVLF